MQSIPVLFLMVGLPGSGKTTRAKEIETEYNALKLTPDDWIIEKYDNNLSPEEHDKVRAEIEKQMWEMAQEKLKAGRNAILDFGFWSKSERDEKRQTAKKLGAKTKIIFLDASVDELWKRASVRPESQKGILHFTKADLEKWQKTFQKPDNEELI